jgi:hypothetical protein
MHYKRISNAAWKIIEEKFEKKLSSWKGKLLSYGERLVLLNSILCNLAMFMLSFYKDPKCVLHKLNFYRSRFFWQGDDHKKKYRLAKWSIIGRPKDQGGLGVIDLGIQNRCLFSKWLFNLINYGVWQQLLRNKSITHVNRKSWDSQFWGGLMNIKDWFLSMGNFKLHDGRQIRFWEDIWLGGTTLKDQYPNLYNIVQKKVQQ